MRHYNWYATIFPRRFENCQTFLLCGIKNYYSIHNGNLDLSNKAGMLSYNNKGIIKGGYDNNRSLDLHNDYLALKFVAISVTFIKISLADGNCLFAGKLRMWKREYFCCLILQIKK